MAKITANNTTTTNVTGPRVFINKSGKGTIRGSVDGLVIAGGMLKANEAKVIKGKNDTDFVSLPSKKVEKDGKTTYYEYYRILDEGDRKAFNAYVIDHVNNAENGTPITATMPENKAGVRAYVTPYTSEKNPNLIGFARVLVNGVEVRDIMIRTKKSDPEDAYISFPSYNPTNKEGEPLMTKDGNKYYKSYVSPASKEAAAEITRAVLEAYEKAVSGDATE